MSDCVWAIRPAKVVVTLDGANEWIPSTEETGLFYCGNHWLYLGSEGAVERHIVDKSKFGNWKKSRQKRMRALAHLPQNTP